MDETMVENWNRVVGKHDKVYHLGDVVINRKYLSVLGRLNGDKVLIKGNHDIFHLKDFTEYFRDVRGYHVLNGLILSHIPIHKDSLARFGCNIHGHLHIARVKKTVLKSSLDPYFEHGKMTDELVEVIDPDYFNVGVECINYTPISLEEACEKIVAQGGQIGFRDGNGPVL